MILKFNSSKLLILKFNQIVHIFLSEFLCLIIGLLITVFKLVTVTD